MSELIEVIAEAYRTIQQVSAAAGDVDGGEARGLLADLELQIAKIETEAARLTRENLELRRHALSPERVEMSTPRKTFPRLSANRPDARKTMQIVSEFYQIASRERLYKKAG